MLNVRKMKSKLCYILMLSCFLPLIMLAEQRVLYQSTYHLRAPKPGEPEQGAAVFYVRNILEQCPEIALVDDSRSQSILSSVGNVEAATFADYHKRIPIVYVIRLYGRTPENTQPADFQV
jgi:hypothetical protein